MKYVALLPVRDEGDIIAQTITHLLTWVDELYVFDTGSLDDSWEVVRHFASLDSRVIPIRKEPVYFSETHLRSHMFHIARQRMRDGDWFLRVDADEFHHVPPPEFVRTRLAKHESVVYHQYYNFCLTEHEVREWEAGRESVADRARPIADRRRYYLPSLYTEPRLCRYRSSMRWPTSVSFPFNAGYVARERLPIRHYPHRDPAQLRRRCQIRALMMADPLNRANWDRPDLHHWSEAEWRRFITSDKADGVLEWRKGEDLPELRYRNHLRSIPVRSIQRLVHAWMLPVLDRVRARYPAGARPQPLQPHVIERLERELRSDGHLNQA